MENYLDINRDTWNQRVKAHLDSAFYNVAGWLAGEDSLKDIELSLLPENLEGVRILHLQCHFGQDTLSLARRGAQVTGVDLSDKAIDAANNLAERAGLTAQSRFINCDLYSLPDHLNETFDIVFTSYGTIGWLPDMEEWADIVARYLRPGGQFVFAEFHPFVWLWNEERTAIKYPYFSKEAIVETASGSYTDGSAAVGGTEVSWDHPLSEVITALIGAGLTLRSFREYDYSPYDCFHDTVEVAPGKYHLKQMPGLIPMVYSLECTKTA
jgi:SAM-dependent methyltransferase